MGVKEQIIVKDYNKIISPFLTVYSPQYTSMFSILQRVSGILLTIMLYCYVVVLKLSKIGLSYYCLYNFIFIVLQGNIFIKIELGIIIFILVIFFYHFYFGLRYIYWDSVGGGKEKDYFTINLVSIQKTNLQLVFCIVVSVLLVFFQVIFFNFSLIFNDIVLMDYFVKYNIIKLTVLTPILISLLLFWCVWIAKHLR